MIVAFLTHSTFASPGVYTVSFTSDEINLAYGVRIRVAYSCIFDISHPSMGGIVSTKEEYRWDIRLQNGIFRLDVHLPSPINRWYNVSQNLPLGSYYDIPITTGTAARVSLAALASLSVSGDASLSKNSVTLDSADAENFVVTTGHSFYSNIAVTTAFAFQVNLGLAIGFYPLSFQIASANIGSFNAVPTITEGSTLLDWTIVLICLLVLGSAIIGISYWSIKARMMRRRTRKNPRTRRIEEEYDQAENMGNWKCPKCSRINSDSAKFCTRCSTQNPALSELNVETRQSYCGKCGTKYDDEDDYCSSCGQKRN